MIIIVACGHTALAEFQWCLIYECNVQQGTHTHTHDITPIVNANNSSIQKNGAKNIHTCIHSEREKLQQCVNQSQVGSKSMYMWSTCFVLLSNKPRLTPHYIHIYTTTENLYQGFSINRIKWHHLLFENRIPKNDERRKKQCHTLIWRKGDTQTKKNTIIIFSSLLEAIAVEI